MKKIFDLQLQEKYFSLIKEGLKTVEGRLAKPKHLTIQPNDCICFNHVLIVKVDKVVLYPSFRQMLQNENTSLVLPDIPSIDEAEAVYRAFYSKKAEAKYGVLAIHLCHIPSTLGGA